jgi:hypothetical protein
MSDTENNSGKIDGPTARAAERARETAAFAALDARDPKTNVIELLDVPERRPRVSHDRSGERASNVPIRPNPRSLPDTVLERFTRVGHTLHFPDGEEALKDYGDRITTRSENTVVIQSIAAIAQHRAVAAVKITQGTDLFKSQAWHAFRLAGIEVDGYAPSVAEEQRLARAVALRQSQDSMLRKQPEEGALIVGRLVAHGAARYQRREGKSMSYFVTLDTSDGPKEYWGIDLERAIRKSLSQVTVGAEVGLRKIASETVKVPVTRYDAQGREMAQEELTANRNTWLIERKDFLEHRATLAAVFRDRATGSEEGRQRHPELAGSYDSLHVAKLSAHAKGASPENLATFLKGVRAKIAQDIEFGKPLDPVPLRNREAGAPDIRKERSLDPELTL